MFTKGDWIICRGKLHQFYEVDEFTPTEVYAANDEYIGHLSECTLWKPKSGEWCWNEFLGLCKYISTDYSTKWHNVLPYIELKSSRQVQNLEPFIGELPTFLKDYR